MSKGGEIKSFPARLRISKGDYLALGIDNFGPGSVGVYDQQAATSCEKGFAPGLGTGDRAKPNPSYSGCAAILLYNATIRRR